MTRENENAERPGGLCLSWAGSGGPAGGVAKGGEEEPGDL